jgi:hypothetical protein
MSAGSLELLSRAAAHVMHPRARHAHEQGLRDIWATRVTLQLARVHQTRARIAKEPCWHGDLVIVIVAAGSIGVPLDSVHVHVAVSSFLKTSVANY